MFTCFSESNYDEEEWPQLWRLEGLVNTVLTRDAQPIHLLPLIVFVSALYYRVSDEALVDGGIPLDSAWTRRTLFREAIALKQSLILSGD